MTFQTTLSEQDFLNYLLFNAAQSKPLQAKRNRYFIFYGVLFFLLAISAYFGGDEVFSAVCLVAGVAWFCFYPLFRKNRHNKVYANYVKQNFAGMVGRAAAIELTDDHIHSTDDISELKISFKGVSEIIETGEYVYIKSYNNILFIIPKNQVDARELVDYLTRIASWHSVKFARV